MPIHQLFPQPIYFSKLERKLTKQELKIIDQYQKKIFKNVGNVATKNNYILEHKAFKNLKKEFNKKIADYFDKIICTNNKIIPCITQSWINYTKKGEFHHKHSHANALVSGILYINAQKETDSIKFYREDKREAIELNVASYNNFNSTSWTFPVETGDIVMFPARLSHGVDKTTRAATRISLSFNVFVKGELGNKNQLTELVVGSPYYDWIHRE